MFLGDWLKSENGVIEATTLSMPAALSSWWVVSPSRYSLSVMATSSVICSWLPSHSTGLSSTDPMR